MEILKKSSYKNIGNYLENFNRKRKQAKNVEDQSNIKKIRIDSSAMDID